VLNIGLARGAQCLLLFSSLVGATACGPSVDLATGLEIDEISTGWLDAGVVDGKNKVVPAVTFKLKNVSDQRLSTLQVNAIFRRVNSNEEWGDGFRTVAGSRGLLPGAATDSVTINAQLGYTGADSHAAMLYHSQFVDAKVDLFAKYGSGQWARIGEYPIMRQLIERQ
jgi:hypothetical protein